MVMPKVRLVLLIILIYCGGAFANPLVGLDYYTHFGTTAETITVIWIGNSPTGYELRAYHHEQQIYIWIGSTNDLQYSFQLPNSGHFTIMLRNAPPAVNDQWSISTDLNVSKVNENPRAWWVYGYVAPPGPIIIK